MSTAIDAADDTRVFRITHAFHPHRDQRYEIVSVKVAWGEARVFYYGADGRLTSIPLAWTDLHAERPAVHLGGGRSAFVAADLLALHRLIQGLLQEGEYRSDV